MVYIGTYYGLLNDFKIQQYRTNEMLEQIIDIRLSARGIMADNCDIIIPKIHKLQKAIVHDIANLKEVIRLKESNNR